MRTVMSIVEHSPGITGYGVVRLMDGSARGNYTAVALVKKQGLVRVEGNQLFPLNPETFEEEV